MLVLIGLGGVMSRAIWAPALGRSLVCSSDVVKSDAILITNFDPSYSLFERAARLRAGGYASRVIATVDSAMSDSSLADPISKGIADLMGRAAGIEHLEYVPVETREPITLHVAVRVRTSLERAHSRSVLVVSPGFRSRRDRLIFDLALRPFGIAVHCAPVVEGVTPENWFRTLHGIQEVSLQFLKLQYYRLFIILPMHAGLRELPGN